MLDSPARLRLVVDLSNTIESSRMTGVQRVATSLTDALTQGGDVLRVDGRTGRLRTLALPARRRLLSLSEGRTTSRTLAGRIETRAARLLPLGRPWQPDTSDVFIDLEAGWFGPQSRAELLPRLRTEGIRTAALVHDVLPLLHPEWFPLASTERFRRWFEAHHDANSEFFAVSGTTADDVRGLTGLDRVPVVRPGVGRRDVGAVGIGPRNASGILMLGTIEPRKGHDTILDALDLLGFEAPMVDVVGQIGWGSEDLVPRLQGHGRVRWHRHTTDAQLKELWHASGLVVQPTRGEGFGLPVVEAMARGVPVLASDIPVMRETSLGAATFLPVDDARAWADALAAFAADPASWPEKAQPAMPGWAEAAEDLWAALAEPDDRRQ